MEEIWKDIKGYEGRYQVGSYGNVKSLARTTIVNGKVCKKQDEVILKPYMCKANGYYGVVLRSGNKRKKQFLIHSLVANNFIPQKNKLNNTVNHIDGNKLNNSLENLEWVSVRENSCHFIDIKKQYSSKYRGVSYRHDINKWKARIHFNKKEHCLGTFKSERAAALSYLKFMLENGIINKYTISDIN